MREWELVDVFVDALNSAGISTRVPDRPEGARTPPDVLIDVGGRTLVVELKGARTVTALEVTRHIAEWQSGIETTDTIPVLVGERIVEGARELLRSLGWGWLDLRGHLHLTGPGLLIDTSVQPVRPRAERSGALVGSAGLEVSSLLLLYPGRPLSVRGIARELGRSPSTVSEILKSLRNEGLLAEDGAVAHRDLFWQLAESWRRPSTMLASLPEPGHGSVNAALLLGMEDVESTTGWALTDTLAATLFGAPVGTRSDYPPDFYVPTPGILRRAVRLLGETQNAADRKATIRIAPVPMICARRIDGAVRHLGNESWPLAHPLFVALDLASDPGRGTEILEDWDTPEPWQRVW